MRILRGHPSSPVFISLFVFFKFEHLQRLLTIGYSFLLTHFRLLLGNQRSTQVIIKALLRLLESVPLRPQGSFCLFCTFLLSRQQCKLSLLQFGVPVHDL